MAAEISVIIPTLNAEKTLPGTLTSLVPATVEGLIKDVIIVDGGSEDATLAIADEMGATSLTAERGRGHQLGTGAHAAKGDWLLFLHADTQLEPGFEREVERFMDRTARTGMGQAAAFRFALDDFSGAARRLETMVALRCRLFGLPYGDQGLLIPRALYDEIGGFSDLPLMEDVDIVRRIGRSRLSLLTARAVTSAEKFQRNGFMKQSFRNVCLVTLYMLRVPPRVLAKLYA